ncbi:MAG: RNA polymerase sigma factor [Coriobacteriales bacterium]
MDAQSEARRLVDTYTPLIMRLGYSYLRSREDAEDLCQETLLKLVRHYGGFADPEHEKAWVVRVAINACKDRLKAAERSRVVRLDSVTEPVAAQEAGDGAVLAAVQELPQTYREPIYLHYGEGYKIAEIAELTGKSEAAVAKNLSRGRAMLRTMLGGEF